MYLGGNGFAAKLCYDRIPVGIDAFDLRNLAVFCTGPVTDSPIPGNNRGCMGGKSPLNGLFFDSTYGGRFPGAPPMRTRCDRIRRMTQPWGCSASFLSPPHSPPANI